MNIGFVGNVPPPVGGAEVFLEGFLSRFVHQAGNYGTQIRWCRQDFSYGSHAGINSYAPMGHREVQGALTTYYLFDSMAEREGRRASMSEIYAHQSIEATNLLRRHDVQLIHAHSLGNLPFAAHAARELSIPLVLTVHGLVEYKSLETFHSKRPEYIKMFRWCLGQAALVIGVSDEIVQASLERGAKKVEKLSCGIDTEYFLPEGSNEPSGSDILFVGSLREDKGARLLLESYFKNAEQLGSDLVFVGKRMIEGQVVKRAESDPRVRFLGVQDAAGVRVALGNAKVVVLPSESEGMPLAMLEAMAFRRPILVSNTGEMSNIIRTGYNGFLLENRTVKGLAEQLVELLGRSDLAAVGHRARETALRYDIRSVVERHVEIYQSLVR